MVICKGKKDCLNYFVFDSRKSMGQQAADDIAKAMEKLLEEKETINMIFAAAPSQNEVLAALTEKKLPWERVNAFHMDEYIGLHEDAPQRFGNFLKKAIFARLPFRSVNYIQGNVQNIEAECMRYGALLRDHPVDIVCLGIGENGHIAFNDPWVADFHDPCMIKQVDLDPMCRNQQVNDGCFASIDEVPKTALTLTIPALVQARYMFCVVPAATKRNAVGRTVNGEISEDCPATIMRRHDNAVLYCDPQSGADLM